VQKPLPAMDALLDAETLRAIHLSEYSSDDEEIVLVQTAP
jgi:hypothetical protein